jgi:hypothetical protein
MKKKWVDVFLFCLLTVCCKAQTEGYHYYCNIDSVKISGFYNLELSPELNAQIKTDFSDVRIINNLSRWVPHVLKMNGDNKVFAVLVVPTEFEKNTDSRGFTELILKNSAGFIDAFDFTAKSTLASRVAKLSGSDDRQNWFVIRDSVLLEPMVSDSTGETKYHIDFLASNYKFFKLAIDNKGNDPLNIVKATTPISDNRDEVRFTVDNPENAIFQKDSGKISYVRVTQNQNYHIDQLALAVSGAKYYYRKLEIRLPESADHSFSSPGTLLQSFYISNNSSLVLDLPHFNTKLFYLLIYNEDNPPLKVDKVVSRSEIRYITAFLEKGGGYKLIMDNPSAIMPNYDLARLNASIPKNAPMLGSGKIIAFDETEIVSPPVKNNKWLLWVAIAVAIIILLFFTAKMLKEVDKRKSA